MDDEFFLDQMKGLIEHGTPSVNPVLPVLNLLNTSDRYKLRATLLKRAEELWKLLKETAKRFSSVKPMEVGADEVSKHLEWAVRYQVYDESFYSIEGDNKDPYDKRKAYAKVRKGALRIIELIDLSPRPTNRGRKRTL